MVEYFDLSDVKMPKNTTCMTSIISNMKIDSYELSISLFDTCQLHCDFCFQAHKKPIDLDYIKSIPSKVIAIVPRLKKYETKTLYIRMWGGELFHDGIDESMFDVYQSLCDDLIKAFHQELPDLNIVFNYMSNGAWSKHRERVWKLLQDNNATIGFSYDPVGRFPTKELKQKMIDNARFFYEKQGHMNLAMTTTKRNIMCLLNEEDEFLKNFPKEYSLEINYYIPGYDWEINLPNDDLIYDMWMYFLKHNMFNCKSLKSYIEPIVYPGRQVFSTCGCKCSDQFSNNCLIRDCIKRTSLLPSTDFYGDLSKEMTDNNAQEIKNYLGTIKRGCMCCPNMSRCAWICFSSILFKEYKATNCPISRLIDYVDEHREEVKEQLERFDKEYDLSKVFYNPSK